MYAVHGTIRSIQVSKSGKNSNSNSKVNFRWKNHLNSPLGVRITRNLFMNHWMSTRWFSEIFNIAVSPKITYLTVLKSEELDFEYEITSEISTEGLKFYIWGFLNYRELSFDYKNCPDKPYGVYTSFFQKRSLLSADPLIAYKGSVGVINYSMKTNEDWPSYPKRRLCKMSIWYPDRVMRYVRVFWYHKLLHENEIKNLGFDFFMSSRRNKFKVICSLLIWILKRYL